MLKSPLSAKSVEEHLKSQLLVPQLHFPKTKKQSNSSTTEFPGLQNPTSTSGSVPSSPSTPAVSADAPFLLLGVGIEGTPPTLPVSPNIRTLPGLDTAPVRRPSTKRSVIDSSSKGLSTSQGSNKLPKGVLPRTLATLEDLSGATPSWPEESGMWKVVCGGSSSCSRWGEPSMPPAIGNPLHTKMISPGPFVLTREPSVRLPFLDATPKTVLQRIQHGVHKVRGVKIVQRVCYFQKKCGTKTTRFFF